MHEYLQSNPYALPINIAPRNNTSNCGEKKKKITTNCNRRTLSQHCCWKSNQRTRAATETFKVPQLIKLEQLEDSFVLYCGIYISFGHILWHLCAVPELRVASPWAWSIKRVRRIWWPSSIYAMVFTGWKLPWIRRPACQRFLFNCKDHWQLLYAVFFFIYEGYLENIWKFYMTFFWEIQFNICTALYHSQTRWHSSLDQQIMKKNQAW